MTTKLFVAGLALALGGVANAATLLSEGFNDISTLAAAGWVQTNNSSPAGGTAWFQGNSGIFPAASGAANAYIGANFLSANGNGDVSNWLITPSLSLANGDTLSFLVRAAGGGYLDTVEARLSTNGASSSVGATTTSLGDFTTLLGSFSATTDAGWVAKTFTITGLGAPTTGRLAFRYVVTDTSLNGNYVGIDSVVVNQVPEPGTAVLWALGAAGLWLARRRA